jgi:hypothetical protein
MVRSEAKPGVRGGSMDGLGSRPSLGRRVLHGNLKGPYVCDMQDDSEEDATASRPLNYRSTSDDVETHQIIAQAIAGCVLVGLQVFASVLFVAASFATHPILGIVELGLTIYGMSLVVRYAVRNVHNSKKKGWIIGIWLGIGLLFEGICFASLPRL